LRVRNLIILPKITTFSHTSQRIFVRIEKLIIFGIKDNLRIKFIYFIYKTMFTNCLRLLSYAYLQIFAGIPMISIFHAALLTNTGKARLFLILRKIMNAMRNLKISKLLTELFRNNKNICLIKKSLHLIALQANIAFVVIFSIVFGVLFNWRVLYRM
jgi:hypothetical protein